MVTFVNGSFRRLADDAQRHASVAVDAERHASVTRPTA